MTPKNRGWLWGLGLALALGWAPAAQAQCEPIDEAGAEAGLSAANQAIAEARFRVAAEMLRNVANNLPCLTKPAPVSVLARLGRGMATVAFYSQDDPQAQRWAVYSKRARPDEPWPDDIPEDDAFRLMVEAAVIPQKGGPAGRGLAAPPGGAVFVDGHLILEPLADADIAHLVQLTNNKGEVIKGFWQEGGMFPEAILNDVPGVARPPKWYKGPPPETSTGVVPKAKTISVVPVAVGGGLVVVAGVLYGVALGTKGSLDEATTTEELTAKRSTANILVISSIGLGVAGLGVGITGVFVSDQGGGMSFGGRF